MRAARPDTHRRMDVRPCSMRRRLVYIRPPYLPFLHRLYDYSGSQLSPAYIVIAHPGNCTPLTTAGHFCHASNPSHIAANVASCRSAVGAGAGPGVEGGSGFRLGGILLVHALREGTKRTASLFEIATETATSHCDLALWLPRVNFKPIRKRHTAPTASLATEQSSKLLTATFATRQRSILRLPASRQRPRPRPPAPAE